MVLEIHVDEKWQQNSCKVKNSSEEEIKKGITHLVRNFLSGYVRNSDLDSLSKAYAIKLYSEQRFTLKD